MSRNHRQARVVPHRVWQAIRMRVFTRDKWRCRECGRAGRLECDHVVPIHRGGHPTDLSNLQSLCRGCHIAKTRMENAEAVNPERAAWLRKVEEIAGG